MELNFLASGDILARNPNKHKLFVNLPDVALQTFINWSKLEETTERTCK